MVAQRYERAHKIHGCRGKRVKSEIFHGAKNGYQTTKSALVLKLPQLKVRIIKHRETRFGQQG